jgi:hypothetical protein
MAEKKELKTVPVGLRITPSLKDALDRAAAEDERPLASFVERVLTDYLRKKGYLKA